MGPKYRTLLEGVSGDNEMTPLKQITQTKLREKHLLIKELGPLLNIKDSQTKRILAGESGTRPAGIRAFKEFLDIPADIWSFFWNADTNRARTFEEFSVLRAKTLDSETRQWQPSSETGQASTNFQAKHKYSRSKMVLALLSAIGVLYSITGFNKNEDPPLATKSQSPCLVEMREQTPPSFECDTVGSFSVVGSTLEKWNTKASLIFVPNGWEAIVRYETWGGQNYSVLQKDKSGFVKLHTGFNHLDSDIYDAHDNESLTGAARRTGERELNDRVQYLIISKATNSDALKVWEHDEKSDPNQIKIVLLDN